MATMMMKLLVVVVGLLFLMPDTMQLSMNHPLFTVVERLNDNGGPFLGLVVSSGRYEELLKNSTYYEPDASMPYVTIAGRRFNIGKFNGEPVIYVLAQGPLANVGATVQLLLDSFRIKGVINFGAAGTVSNQVFIADVVIPSQVAFTGVWNWEKFGTKRSDPSLKIGDYNLPEAGENSLEHIVYKKTTLYTPTTSNENPSFLFDVHPEWVQLASQLNFGDRPTVHIGGNYRIGSADVFMSNVAYGSFLKDTFGISLVDTASAAVVSTSIANGIPHIVFRGASNRAGSDSDPRLSAVTANNVLKTVAVFISNISPKTKTLTRRNSVRAESNTAVSAENRRVTLSQSNDSLEICRVLNGMWQTSGGWGRIDRNDAVEAMLRHADAGLSTFDMADHYGPAEDLYGIFINRVRRERPPQLLENVRGLTKWVPSPVKMSRSFVEKSIDVSRKRMDVACLDMLQFHWWDYANSGYLDALKHLTDLKDEGKIKTVALTNFDTERLRIILENDIPIVSNQVQHSIIDMRPQQKMAELCQQKGVKLITYGTVMGGLLSEKFLDTNLSIPFAGPPLNTPSLQKYKRMVDAWGGWSQFQVLLQKLNQIARKHGVSIATVAVKFILDQPAVAGSMIGVRLGLSDHIQDANAIFSLNLDEEDAESIREISSRGKDLMRVIGDCGDEYRRA